MENNSTSLYKWDRVSNPRVYSRSQRVATDTDIKDWIKTVEDASERAAANAFGRPVIDNRAYSRRQRTLADVKSRVQDAQLHEAAYAEAQDLLQQWVNDKIRIDAEADYSDETWTRNTEADIKKEWNQLLSSDADLEIDALVNEPTTEYSELLSARSKDPYAMLRRDPNDMVQEVLDRMYDTELVPATITRDLGLDDNAKSRPDPRTKMTLRHQQVKENREKRLREKEKKLRDLQSRKEATFKARQIVMKEEKAKENKKKKEELDIQAEMAKIKKEMEEERKKQEEEKQRMRKEREELERQTREEYERQLAYEDKHRRKAECVSEDRRRQILRKMQEIESRRATENMRLKQNCFSAWYNVVIDRRLKSGRAKALRDWRLLGKIFNAWKAHAREKSFVRQAWLHEEKLKQTNRHVLMAEEYWRHTLLRKCMTAWQVFVSQQQTSKELSQDQEKTRSKMNAFLQAAKTGQLWSGRSDGDTSDRSNVSNVTKSTAVNAIFNERKTPSRITSTRNESSRTGPRQTHRPKGPTDAWQINRKQIQPTEKEIDAVVQNRLASCSCNNLPEGGDKTGSSTPCSKCQQSPSPERPKTWRKPGFVVNNFEHRHAAQQRILEMQQKQIEEQQRLIEELQYLQKQQMLQQKLLQQENAKIHLGGNTEGADGIHKTLSHLQSHISKLQQQLLDSGAKSLDTNPAELPTHRPSTVQDIQVTDLETTRSEQSDHGLKLDLSEVNGEETKDNDNKANASGATLGAKFGQTKVLSKESVTRPSSSRSAASSHATSKVPSTSRSNASRHENFLKTMEERAAERQQIKKERDLRKQEEEQRKYEELMIREAELRREEEEEKVRRIEAHREKKRADKQKEKDRQALVERMCELNERADAHYMRAMLKWRGLYAFQKLIKMAQQREEQAACHYRVQLQKKVLLSWRIQVQRDIEGKNKMADEFNNYLVTKRCFSNWTKYKQAQEIQLEKASRHHETRLLLRMVRVWADHTADEKVSMWHKERIAREHNPRRLMKTYFSIWRRFPQIRRENEERERRREEMRKKVAGMLHDYEGIRVSQSNDNQL